MNSQGDASQKKAPSQGQAENEDAENGDSDDDKDNEQVAGEGAEAGTG